MEQLPPVLVPLLTGTILGVAIASVATWRILRSRIEAATRQVNEAQIEATRLREQNTRLPELQEAVKSGTREIQRLGAEAAALQSQFAVSQSDAENQLKQNGYLHAEIEDLRGQNKQSATDQEKLKVDIATLNAELEAERRQTPEKTAFLNELANQILEDKSKRFTDQNQENLNQILGPLKTKLQEFQQKVEDVYDKEGTARTALTTQVKQLMDLNQQLSQDAHNLTQALKGSGKAQGVWGERVLERVLEMSGLRKGHEYELRETYKREDGSRAQPDAVVHLPEDKHIVVDAKVSLTARTSITRIRTAIPVERRRLGYILLPCESISRNCARRITRHFTT